MRIINRYNLTIEALKKGHRFLEPLSTKEIKEIEQSLSTNSEHLLISLCLLQNTSSFLPQLSPQLISLLNSSSSSETLIHVLNASRKHIIEGQRRLSKRPSIEFIDTLRTLLAHDNWELKEWTLRTIDECGSQARILKPEILKIYPSKLGMLTNTHKKNVRGIIDLLLRGWK